MAEQGRGNFEVIKQLRDSVEDFIEIADEEISDIVREKDALSSAWDDEQYEEFSNYIDDLSRSLKSELGKLELVKHKLTEIINKMGG